MLALLPMLLVWTFTGLEVCASTFHVKLLDTIRYFPDYDLWHDNFPCSDQEQACFKENKLLFEKDGNCYSVGQQGPCSDGEIFHADKAEALRKGGHLRGTCEKSCPGVDHAPLAATGECMSKDDVQRKICPVYWYLQPEMDVFAEWVCGWSITVCPQKEKKPDPYRWSNNGLCSPPQIFLSTIKSERNAKVSDHIPDDHPLLEYFSNYTFLEREFPCSEEEKACLQYGRMLSSDGNCYTLYEMPPSCKLFSENFNLDLDEANREGGKLQWICSPNCNESNGYQKEAEKCLGSYQFYSEICRREWGLQTHTDQFRRNTCKCAHSDRKPLNIPPTLPPTLPSSSLTPGFCRLPDFSNPVEAPQDDLTLTVGFEAPCSEEEFACFQEGKVLAMGACHALRTRGPCAENEQLILDKEALAHAQLKAKCSTSPCAEGSVRMPIDGKCLTHKQAQSMLCPMYSISLDEFGGWQCSDPGDEPSYLSSIIRHKGNGTCELLRKYVGTTAYSWNVGGSVSDG